jgi:stage III sporulation protein SpoIIIAA
MRIMMIDDRTDGWVQMRGSFRVRCGAAFVVLSAVVAVKAIVVLSVRMCMMIGGMSMAFG